MNKNIATKNVTIIALVLVLISLSHSIAWAVDATLSWYPPTVRTNGTALTNLGGYKVYYGVVSSNYTKVMDVGLTGNPFAPVYKVTNLAAGNTYYFVVTAYDASGKESGFSNQVSKTVTSTPTTTVRITTTSTRSTTTTVRTSMTTTTTIPNQLPSADGLTLASITTAPGVTQTFTATYSNPSGWQNLSNTTFYLVGNGKDQWVRYNPATSSFTLLGGNGYCKSGQAAILSSSFLSLNCSTSNVSALGTTLAVTFSLTPKPAFSGTLYRLVIIAYDLGGKSNGKTVGNWTITSGPG